MQTAPGKLGQLEYCTPTLLAKRERKEGRGPESRSEQEKIKLIKKKAPNSTWSPTPQTFEARKFEFGVFRAGGRRSSATDGSASILQPILSERFRF